MAPETQVDVPEIPGDGIPAVERPKHPPLGDRLPAERRLPPVPGRGYRIPPTHRMPGRAPTPSVQVSSGWHLSAAMPEGPRPKDPEEDGRKWLPGENRWETPGEALSREAAKASRDRNGAVDYEEWMRSRGNML